METYIRHFHEADAQAVSSLIRENLLHVNSRDYTAAVIDYMHDLFTPDYLRSLAATDDLFVAEHNGIVVGTVTLHGDEIRALYVDPAVHGRRVGEQLLRHVEHHALLRHVHLVHLSASLTAVGFYEKMGYRFAEMEQSDLFGPAYHMTKLL